MNDFADVDPQFWFDDSQVLIVRAQQPTRTLQSSGLLSAARKLMSAAVFGLAVVGLTSLSASTSDHVVRSFQVANERAPNGLSRRYWQGLTQALDRAPEVEDFEETDEPEPFL